VSALPTELWGVPWPMWVVLAYAAFLIGWTAWFCLIAPEGEPSVCDEVDRR